MNTMILILVSTAVILASQLILWRKSVSRTTELTTALTTLAQAVNDLAARIGALNQNVTPDADVDAAITQITAATDQVNSLAK